jgi:1,4-dihydroxy-2-naphthoyl-CoA synthase
MMDAPVTETQPAATLRLANVLYEKKDAIAYVTVNRPKVLNALNTPTWADIRTAFEDARDDMAVQGVILTGAGNKAFIAGADISELSKATALDAERASRFGQGVLDLIENLGKPVIAAVNGFALGGGCETAMAQRNRAGIGSAHACRGHLKENRVERPHGGEVRAHRCEQGIGDEPGGGHLRLSRKARAPVPRPLRPCL